MIPESVEQRVMELSRRLRECKIPHAFGGAIAYVCYGMPRGTNDYDINIFLPEKDASSVFECLSPIGVAWDAQAIGTVEKTGQVRLDWDDQKVDLFFAYAPFHEEIERRVREEPVSDESITAPGLSIIDVRKDLRPHPLPGPGALIAAAGPVFPGSAGQMQIQSEEVRVAGR